jgi:hypothetical protein
MLRTGWHLTILQEGRNSRETRSKFIGATFCLILSKWRRAGFPGFDDSTPMGPETRLRTAK